jgi:hypothetical protein
MQRKKIAVVLVMLIVAASAIMIAVASTGTGNTQTWEKTFEVKKPEVTAKITIGNNKIVGYPVKIWVSLRVQVPSEENQTKFWNRRICHCNESIYSINGTYSADLLWFNTTANQWQQVKILQPEINVTITCRWHTNTYVFTPTLEGQYKVVVTFTTNSETQTFTSED